ncbi:hypothetical protein RJ55_01715 [Drechmeria coniospora]|nr:hypothetical protein RJ55_01715 [Drechmeria coniospora]
MKSILAGLLAFGLLVHAAPADVPTENKTVQQPGILQLPLVPIARKSRRVEPPILLDTAEEEETANTTVKKRQVEGKLYPDLTQIYYAVALSIGTPPQRVLADIDTASSLTWVFDSSGTSRNSVDPDFVFDKLRSQTLVPVGQQTTQRYGGGYWFVTANAYMDEIALGPAALGSMKFGIAAQQDSNMDRPLVGLAFPHDSERPDFILDRMVDRGVINSRAFSVYISDQRIRTGSILFGGIDRTMYTGALQRVPMIPSPLSRKGRFTRPTVQMSRLSILEPTGSGAVIFDKGQGPPSAQFQNPYITSEGIGFVIDTGAPMCYFPPHILANVLVQFPNAHKNGEHFQVDCSLRHDPRVLKFEFGAHATIHVPMKDFVWQSQDQSCWLGATEAPGKTPQLGISFLRSAYVTFDYDNLAVHMAQSVGCVTGASGLVAIDKGPGAVPAVDGLC